MTLLLAPFDVLRRPSAATWKCSRDRNRRRLGKLSHQIRPHRGIRTGNFVWLWTLFTALLVVLVPFLLSNKSALFFPASSDEDNDKSASTSAFENLLDSSYAMESTRAFGPEEASLAPISLSDHGAILDGAKLLLSLENVALLDALRSTTFPLKHAVRFSLQSLTVAEDLNSPNNNAKRKNAGVASRRLARVTVYWPDEGDFYTRSRKSSTGTRLRDGHCAVDPKVIPYGSVVNVPGVGRLVAVDTGAAVVSRRAARTAGRTRDQRKAIVIDVFCSTRAKARALIKRVKHFAVVTWQRPDQVAEL
jgi:3D (Asp-Asp-Asp) domain-containing protein